MHSREKILILAGGWTKCPSSFAFLISIICFRFLLFAFYLMFFLNLVLGYPSDSRFVLRMVNCYKYKI